MYKADNYIAGIMRAGAYSPNYIGRDAAIFYSTVDELRRRGCRVNIYSEESFCRDAIAEPVIINMCREEESLAKLKEYEDAGRLVVNSARAIERCIHGRASELLLASGVNYPESVIVDTSSMVKPVVERLGFERCWVKKADHFAMHREDVSGSDSYDETQRLVNEYRLRGISTAEITRHVTGEVIKFYGVGNSFFHLLAATKPGRDQQEVKFDTDAITLMCRKGAEAIGLSVYGGDCIASPDGTLTIINYNDWPSFAPCREQAATAIAKEIISLIKHHR